MKEKTTLRISGYTSVFLLLVYLIYYLNQVDTSLIYYWQQSIAITFGEALRYPGGFSELFGDLILELLANSIKGSLCLAFLMLGIFISLAIVFRSYKNRPLFLILITGSLIPFFFPFSYYKLPIHWFTDIFLAILITAVYSLWSPKKRIVKFIYLFVSGGLIYLVTGVAGLIIFFQINLILTIISREYFDVISIISLFLIPLLYLPFNLTYSFKTALLGMFLLPELPWPNTYYIVLFIPGLFILILFILDFFFAKIFNKWPVKISGTFAVVILSILLLITQSEVNEIDRNNLKIEQASFEKNWEEVLFLSTNLTGLNPLIQFEINRALGNTGKLLDSLFWTPQPYAEKGIFLEDGNYTSRTAIHISDFYFDLGYASETRHWSTEAQMILSRHPLVLKNLILSSIAQDDIIYAKKYMEILSRSPAYKDWYDDLNNRILNNTIHEVPDIGRLVVNNPKNDFFAVNSIPTLKLLEFYKNNQDNYLAFQFLLASYLLQNQVDVVVAQLDNFNRFGLKILPRNVEEAILIFMMTSSVENSFLANYSVSRNTMADFQDFNQLMIASKDMADAKIKVSKYRRTYWYYYLFTSPYRAK